MTITTTFANLPDGLQMLSLFDQAFAEAAAGVIPEPREITSSTGTVTAGESAIAVVRVAPSTTTIFLPAVLAQGGIPLRVFDWSSSVTDHVLTITPHGTETIMRQSTWPLYSNASNLASVLLTPSVTLGGWYIAP